MTEESNQQNQTSYDLTQGNVWKIMFRFALPIFLGTLFQSLYIMADAIIVGRFAGKDALAAIESVYTLTKLPINFFTGLASGATIIISQYFGARKFKEVSDASHNAVLFAFAGGSLLAVLGCLLSPPAIRLVKVPAEILGDAQHYILIYFSGLGVSMLYNMGAGILRALGNSKTPFYFLVVANLVNVLLDLLFIITFDLGVVGAALATVLSQVLSAGLILAALGKTDLPCKITLRKLKFHKSHLSEIFKLGLPIGIQSTLYPVSNTIVQASINSIGVDAIAAWAVCGKLDFLVWAICEAFGIAVSTFVAQNHGAGNFGRNREGVRAALIMGLFSVGIVSGVLFFGSRFLAGFLVDDANVIRLTSQIMYFIAPMYAIFVFCEVFPGAIRGSGDTFRPMMVSVFGTCISRVLWIFFIVPLNPTLLNVLACYPVSWGISALAFFVLYRKRFSPGRSETGER